MAEVTTEVRVYAEDIREIPIIGGPHDGGLYVCTQFVLDRSEFLLLPTRNGTYKYRKMFDAKGRLIFRSE